MSNDSDESAASLWRQPLPLLLICLAALLFGLYARFKGLGTWSLSADEYYIARSVQNILSTGVPKFDCGGFYLRGLLFQYLATGLELAGMSAEFSARLLAALSSLAALPAVYWLGRRVHSPTIGLLAVALLAVSVWEVEMARFGRMYAPFQAVFVWYMVYFVKYTVDGDKRSLGPMIALTFVGILTWEGGVFLAIANLLPPFLNNSSGRLSTRDWIYIVPAGALLLLVVWFVTADTRTIGPQAYFPDGYVAELNARNLLEINDTAPPWSTLRDHPAWIGVALVPIAAALLGLRWVWTFRERWLAALGLVAALAAALIHQFAAFATIIILLMLFRLIHWKELLTRASAPFHASIVLSGVFWLAYGLMTRDWYAGVQTAWLGGGKLALLIYEFLRYPDYLREIVAPWAGAIPLLGVGLLLLTATDVVLTIRRDDDRVWAERVLLVVVICLLAAASASDPPRHETRYIFFLYPVLVVIGVTVIVRVFETARLSRLQASTLGAITVLGLFGLSEDFRPLHLLKIDTAAVNFRVNATGGEEAHFIPRSDPRGAANWLTTNSNGEHDLVINGVPTVDFYFLKFDYSYIDWGHRRFEAYSCRRGTVERWSNLPLLYTVEAVESEIANADRAFLVIDGQRLDAFLQRLAQWQPRVAWSSLDGRINVIELRGP